MTVKKFETGEVNLEVVVRRACADMTWLVPTDQPAVELAIKYAKWLDATPKADYVAKDIGQRLEAVLIALGATPRDRLKMLGTETVAGSRLAELRAKRKTA